MNKTRRISQRLARGPLGIASFSFLVAVAVAACSAAPTESTATSQSPITGGLITRGSEPGQITNGNGGCLDLPNGNTTNGNLLHIWACDASGVNQTWYVDSAGSIHYAANPTKCIDFPSQGLVNGVPTDQTQLQIWDCNGASGPDQVWQFSWANQIQFAADTAKCVELRNGSSANNTPVQVYDCNGTSGQTWAFVQGGGVQGFQLQDGNGACLEAPSTASGTGLVLAQCNGSNANQEWSMDGRGLLFLTTNSSLCATFPAQDWTTSGAGFVPDSQLQLQGCSAESMTLSSSTHNLVVEGKPCVEAMNGSAANGTVVEGYTCNGTLGQEWFPFPLGETCPGTVSSGGACVACGGAGGAPCAGTQVGCNAGLVAANVYGGNPMGSTVHQECVSACGNIGQLPCANGPTGYNTGLGSTIEQAQAGQSLGGCTEWDAVMLWYSGSNLCQWPVTCGHGWESCCDAGNAFQGPNATTDTCHDGSTPTYVPGEAWQCVPPGGGISGGGGSGTCTTSYSLYEVCDGICENLSPVTACSEAAAATWAQQYEATCAAVYQGACP